MRTITIDLINDRALKLLKNLEGLNIIRLHKERITQKTAQKDEDDSKENIILNIKKGLKDLQLFKQGKLETISEEDFMKELNEL
ncbi:MAG: hypothetical protein K2X94_01180 [Amoebophilaceae bacterium]|nr:hypothetical protein [Amoebophilaceae bacterium]